MQIFVTNIFYILKKGGVKARESWNLKALNMMQIYNLNIFYYLAKFSLEKTPRF